jgi:hypothetical protein
MFLTSRLLSPIIINAQYSFFLTPQERERGQGEEDRNREAKKLTHKKSSCFNGASPLGTESSASQEINDI